MKKYLKAYTAITTGSMAGRDDGYPYTAYSVYDNIKELAKFHGQQKDEQYFEIHAVNELLFLEAVEKAKEEINAEKKKVERERKLKEIERLQREVEAEDND